MRIGSFISCCELLLESSTRSLRSAWLTRCGWYLAFASLKLWTIECLSFGFCIPSICFKSILGESTGVYCCKIKVDSGVATLDRRDVSYACFTIFGSDSLLSWAFGRELYFIIICDMLWTGCDCKVSGCLFTESILGRKVKDSFWIRE